MGVAEGLCAWHAGCGRLKALTGGEGRSLQATRVAAYGDGLARHVEATSSQILHERRPFNRPKRCLTAPCFDLSKNT